MTIAAWDDRYSVTIPEIDAQHKRLFDLINAFYESILRKQDDEGMKKIIAGLIQYTEFHIQYEERLMDRAGYTGLEAQRRVHRAFVQKALTLKDEFETGKLLLGIEVTNFLKDWLVDHILATDMQYVGCLTGKGPAVRN